MSTTTRRRHYATTDAAGRENAARQWAAAIDIEQGARVQFTLNGATVTGTLENRGAWEVRRPAALSVINYSIDVRHSSDEVRRYMLSAVTDLRAAPLTGELPECAAFVGNGARCGGCRILRRNHA